MKNLIKDQVVTYRGRGFIGYEKGNNTMRFIEYFGSFDAYVEYANSKGSFKMLVSIYDIE